MATASANPGVCNDAPVVSEGGVEDDAAGGEAGLVAVVVVVGLGCVVAGEHSLVEMDWGGDCFFVAAAGVFAEWPSVVWIKYDADFCVVLASGVLLANVSGGGHRTTNFPPE